MLPLECFCVSFFFFSFFCLFERLIFRCFPSRFSDLCSILEPGRPVKTDKSAILSDAIRVLNQLRTEAKDLKEANEKLQEDIKVLKVCLPNLVVEVMICCNLTSSS